MSDHQRIVVEPKTIVTSNFAAVGTLKSMNIQPIGIAVGPPRWYQGRHMKQLAPTFAMMKMSWDDYDIKFEEILAKHDPEACWNAIPDNSALLCWEPPGVRCHRRWVAEWLEQFLDVTVTEFGFDRKEIGAYKTLPKEGPGKKVTKAAKDKRRGQSFLFTL